LGSQLLGGSSQTDPTIEVPEGHYAADNMAITVVPNRNMIMLALATGFAISHDIQKVAYAAHAGDHAQYADCRPEFINAFQSTLWQCHSKPLNLLTPFMNWSKADIVKRGFVLKVPFETTRSCYTNQATACGRCGTCIERLEAFHIAGGIDPIEYTDRSYWEKVCRS